MPKKILALTRYDRLGASSRVRVLQYLPHLARHGWHVDVHPLFNEEDLLRLYKEGRRSPARLIAAFTQRIAAVMKDGDSGIVWLQQELFPFLPFAAEAFLLKGRRLVVDFDDAHHLYYKDLRSAVGRRLYADKIDSIMRRANAVTVGSPMMAHYAQTAGARRVHLVHSAVDTTAFPVTPPPASPFTVGWIGTPMTAAQSLYLIKDPLAQFLKETGAHATFIGMEQSQFPDLPGARVPWSEAAERDLLPGLSVGLCPLDDSPWTRGKSGYKIIQYMAAARPALASPVGIAADIVEDGVTGFHCSTPDDWYRRLHQLHADRGLLQMQGAHSRTAAETRYDTAIAAAALDEIFEDCLRG